MRKIFDALFFLIVVTFLLFICTRAPQWWDKEFPLGEGEAISILVLPNQTAQEIARHFEKEGVVENAKELSKWMTTLGIDRKIKTGIYMIRKGSPWEVAKQLGEATPFHEKVTLIPGSDIFSLAEQFEKITTKDIANLLLQDNIFDSTLEKYLPADAETRVALLLPDTYYVAEKTPTALIKSGSSLWWSHFGKVVRGKKFNDKDITSLAIIASLIEREAKQDDERAIIAGVIYNRLEKKMPLQIDASIVYAWKRKGETLQRVLYKHLELESPYNTYKNLGLPPTAICVPSAASWEAAFTPEKNEYLYYVVEKDGRHAFAKTYKEHLANIRRIKRKRR